MLILVRIVRKHVAPSRVTRLRLGSSTPSISSYVAMEHHSHTDTRAWAH